MSEAIGTASTLRRPRFATFTLTGRFDPGAACGFLLPVAVVTYLGVRGGGYDTIVSSQVGILAWWLILLLVGFGLVRVRLSAAAWVGFGLLVAYAAWTALSMLWTESRESTMTDISQMLLYVALAALVLLVHGRQASRFMLHGLGTAIVAVAVVALLSRLQFQWFAAPATAQALPNSARKLSYPLNYWNALAALMAIGIPVLLYSASASRTLVMRGAAAGCLPILALCTFLTVSRGGTIAIAIGLVVFLALAPERLSKLAIALTAAVGSVLLIVAANQRTAVRGGLRTALAAHQGNQMTVITIVSAAGVGLLVAAIVLVERHVERPRLLVVSRRRMTGLSATGLLIAVLVFVAAGGAGFVSREWRQFKTAGAPATLTQGNALQRLQNVTGNGRYQYWQSAIREADTKPLTGTGAGTFQFWWAAHGTRVGGFVIDAHSLYLQALGELGYPGLVLIVGFVTWILICGAWRAVRSRDPATRLALAAATAGATVFALSAVVEWIWFIPVLPAALFVLAAVIFARDGGDTRNKTIRRSALGVFTTWLQTRPARIARGAAVAAVSLGAIVVIMLPMAATSAARDSQALVRGGELTGALSRAIDAVQLQPYAATPWVQEALVREQAGDMSGAVVDARHATRLEPANWSPWLVLSRLEARSGHASEAVVAFDRARSLNPRSPIFAQS